MSISDLQVVLDDSKAEASAFTRTLQGDELNAAEVSEFVNATRNVTVAVVRRDGRPHAAPVIGGCADGVIYVTVSPGSVLANCLERSSEVAFTVADLVHTVIGTGTARKVGRRSEVAEVTGALDRASPYGDFAPGGWDGFIYALEPRKLFAF